MDPTHPELARLASRLRFRHFELLVALAETGSLRAAAQRMHLTQPALSRSLEEIEGVLGIRLFSRTSRGLVPTAHGVAATRSAQQILEELSRFPQEVGLGVEASARVCVGAPHFVAHSFLPPVIARLAAMRPRVHVVLVERPVPELFAALHRGEVDALVTTYAPQHVENVPVALHQEKLYDSKYELVAAIDRPQARLRREISLAELVDERWILPTQGSMFRKEIDWTFRRAGLLPPQPVVEANNPTTSLQLVASGIGLGFAPEETLKRAPPGTVKKLRCVPRVADSPVALIHRAGRRNARIDALRAALRI